MGGYLRPVTHQGGVSTFLAHTRRTRPSSEPGVDFYCPIGSPVYAVWSGVVVAVGGGIVPATGRYVTIDLDDGRRVRYLHLQKQRVSTGQRVRRGDVIGLSGASGYGSEYFGASSLSRIPSNTGGPHVHVTLWPGHWQRFGATTSGAIDIQQYISAPAAAAGSASTPLIIPSEEDSMFIAIVRNKDWYAVTGGKAFLLGAASNARRSGAPILEFPDDWSVNQLKTAVTGIK